MTQPRPDTELFEELLAAETGAWADAKRDAFVRICDAFPGPHGPGPEGLRQLHRGAFTARVPREWRPVFVEVYQQWLGFAAEQAALRPAPRGSLGWWFEARGQLRALPRGLWPFVSPAALLALGFLLAGAVVGARVRERAEAETWLRSVMATTTMLDEDLATVEWLALASLMGGSDPSLESYLASEAALRSRFDAAERERGRLAEGLSRIADEP